MKIDSVWVTAEIQNVFLEGGEKEKEKCCDERRNFSGKSERNGSKWEGVGVGQQK